MATELLVLAVDDEPGILRLIRLELSQQDMRVLTASDGEEALRLAEQFRPDVVVLDVMMPGLSGLEVMKRLRERTEVPIILLTGLDHDEQKVQGLDMGADDYLVKPFNGAELAARVRAVVRRVIRPAEGVDSVIRAGDVEIDLGGRQVTKAGKVVELTRTEWALLQELALNAGRVMLNAELLNKVWGPEFTDDLQYLRVWVSRLRSKLEDQPANPRIIRTQQGLGYQLDAQQDLPD
jgi:two-component system KDP operon response regulator KdpE